jgi:hypothetical protein
LETQPYSEREEHEEVLEDEEEDEDVENIQDTKDMPQPCLTRSSRVKNPPTRYDDYVSSMALVSIDGEPSYFQEAIKVSKIAQWKKSMKEELDSLERNKTWDLVEIPKDRKVVSCKWVYKLKKGSDDKVERYKERLVEKGYSQKEGIDFHEIFSPVVMLVSVSIGLALVALHNLELEKLDIKTMFLHGDLDGDIYMEKPEGFVHITIRGLFANSRSHCMA